MPRKTPLTKRETEIIARLRDYREALHLSRVDFAREIQVDSEILSRIENLRLPVKCDIFWKINHRFPLNPIWLASGLEPVTLVVPLPEMEKLKIKPTDLFSSAYDSKLESRVREFAIHTLEEEAKHDGLKSFAPTAQGRSDALLTLELDAATWIACVPDAYLNKFVSELKAFAVELYGKYLRKSSDTEGDVIRRGDEVQKLRDESILRGLGDKGRRYQTEKESDNFKRFFVELIKTQSDPITAAEKTLKTLTGYDVKKDKKAK